jgi:hypothetical protein
MKEVFLYVSDVSRRSTATSNIAHSQSAVWMLALSWVNWCVSDRYPSGGELAFAPLPRSLKNIVSTAAMHTPLPTWVNRYTFTVSEQCLLFLR